MGGRSDGGAIEDGIEMGFVLDAGQRGVRRIQGLWSDHGHHCLQQAKASITFTFLLKVSVHALPWSGATIIPMPHPPGLCDA